MGGSSGSGSAPTQTTTQILSPQQQQLFDLAMPGLTQFAASTPTRYGGSTIAPFGENQLFSQQLALDAAGRQAGTQRAATGAYDFWTAGPGGGGAADLFDPTKNVNIQNAITGAIDPVKNTLLREALPAVRSGAVGAGGYGGSRQGIAEALAMDDFSRAALGASGKITTDIAQNLANNQLKALSLTPTIQDAQIRPAATVGTVGDVQQQQQQALLDEQVQNFNFDQYAPFLRSQEIMSLLSGVPGGSTVSTGSVPSNTGSPWGKALGGAATGASIGSAFGPWGTGIGAIGGATLPFLFA